MPKLTLNDTFKDNGVLISDPEIKSKGISNYFKEIGEKFASAVLNHIIPSCRRPIYHLEQTVKLLFYVLLIRKKLIRLSLH